MPTGTGATSQCFALTFYIYIKEGVCMQFSPVFFQKTFRFICRFLIILNILEILNAAVFLTSLWLYPNQTIFKNLDLTFGQEVLKNLVFGATSVIIIGYASYVLTILGDIWATSLRPLYFINLLPLLIYYFTKNQEVLEITLTFFTMLAMNVSLYTFQKTYRKKT